MRIPDWAKTELNEFKWTTILAFFTIVIIPMVALFLFSGAENSDYISKSSFYGWAGGISLIYIMTMTFIQIMLNKKYFVSNVVLNDPEYSGVITNKQDKPFISLKNIIFICILLFSLIGFFSTINNEFFLIGIPTSEMQVQETGDILLSSEPASFVETLLFIPIVSILLTLSYLKFKLKNKMGLHYLMVFLGVPIACGIGWLILHFFRYAGSETSLVGVFLFGFFGGLLYSVTGTPITWWIYHNLSNAFYKMNAILPEKTILIIFILIWAVTITIWVSTWVSKELKKGAKSEN